MEKVLLVARLGKFFSDFELSDISILQAMGYEVWTAGNFSEDNHKLDATGVKKVHLNFQRSPLSLENIREYRKLVRLLRENDFKLLHCHMPIGGVFARLAAHKCNLHPVIYTAHGFQFCKGGPLRDWLLFYPVEKFLSRYTDVLITINEEDHRLAKRKFHMKQLVRLHGVGVDTKRYANALSIRDQLSEEFGFDTKDFLILSVGELRKLKNHEVIIRAIAQMKDTSIQYFICGKGGLQEYLESLIQELHLEQQVHLLGYRDDIANICRSVDVFAFPSTREGCSMALMEAMSAGLPVVASEARGNTELIQDGVNGILCHRNIPEEYAAAIATIRDMDFTAVQSCSEQILEPYCQEQIRKKMSELYRMYLKG